MRDHRYAGKGGAAGEGHSCEMLWCCCRLSQHIASRPHRPATAHEQESDWGKGPVVAWEVQRQTSLATRSMTWLSQLIVKGCAVQVSLFGAYLFLDL